MLLHAEEIPLHSEYAEYCEHGFDSHNLNYCHAGVQERQEKINRYYEHIPLTMRLDMSPTVVDGRSNAGSRSESVASTRVPSTTPLCLHPSQEPLSTYDEQEQLLTGSVRAYLVV